MSVIEVKVPDIGDYKNVPVVEIQIRVGDRIEKDQPLVSLESDKALIDIPAPSSGVVSRLDVGVGDKVSEGSVLLSLDVAQAVPSPKLMSESAEVATIVESPPAESKAVGEKVVVPLTPAIQRSPGNSAGYAGPAVRKFARELGVDLAEISGSGERGRVSRADVLAAVKGRLVQLPVGSGLGVELVAWPEVDFAKFGSIRVEPLSRIKKISGASLHRNWVRIPHVTNHDEVDVTELETLRQQLNLEHSKAGLKVTFLAFLIKACAAALKRFPVFNTSLEGESLVYKDYVHIGFAADTPNGLVVPVIRDADQKGVLQISTEMSELSSLARQGKLKPLHMQGGCFSVSSLGGIGGNYFTPIINAPEVAILGLGKACIKPIWRGSFETGQALPRLMMPLSLSWDHRVVDGAEAGRFLAFINRVAADFRQISL